MSWITGLAGKAESFLNNLDNSAAEALSKSQDGEVRITPPKSSMHSYKRSDPLVMTDFEGHITAPVSAANRSAPSSVTPHVSLTPSASHPTFNTMTSARQDTDAELFEFLNNTNQPPPAAKKPRSYTASLDASPSQQQAQETDQASSGYFTIGASDVRDDVTKMGEEDPPLEMENKLLRSEVSSLSQEISSLLQRNHRTEEEVKRLRGQVEKVMGQLREADKRARELSASKDDVEQLVYVKDSQLAAMREEINAVMQGEARLKGDLDKLSSERSSLLNDHTSSQEAQSQALEDVRNQLTRCENELMEAREALHRAQADNDRLRRTVEDSKLKQTEVLRRQETGAHDDRRRADALIGQLEVAKQRHDALQRELRDYKDKATKILQMKEKVIASLKGESSEEGPGLSEQSAGLRAELQSMKGEREMMREEVQRLRLSVEGRDLEVQDLEQQMASESETLRRNCDLLEEQLDREKQVRQDSEEELAQLRREYQFSQERALRQKTEFHDHLASKDTEIQRLRSMLTVKANQTEGQAELETRVRHLTENLIQKQTALDTVKAERHSMQVKLERTERDLEALERSHISLVANADASVRSGGGSRTDDYIRIDMQDPPLTKNVKKAVNTLDAFSIRLGVFMRRYPPARLFLLVYTLLLHLWVFFVLVTYQPEIHGRAVPMDNVVARQQPVVQPQPPGKGPV